MGERERAAERRAAALAGARGRLVSALEEERRGYVQRGLPERVALVDAEIARITGGDADPHPTGHRAVRR